MRPTSAHTALAGSLEFITYITRPTIAISNGSKTIILISYNNQHILIIYHNPVRTQDV